MPINIQKYGWKPDLPDIRDVKFSVAPKSNIVLPPMVDMRSTMPMIWNQGSLGSCTAHSTSAQCWFIDKTDPYEPSRLFVYYNTRVLEGTVKFDSGASIRNAVKSVAKYGFCKEADWPYDIEHFTTKPSLQAFENARKQKAIRYMRIAQNARSIKTALFQGYPVNFGFMVYDSFESDETRSTGMVKMPSRKERSLGGHAVLIVGYNDDMNMYIIRNSWGIEFGMQGYFYMPYDYIHTPKLASDFWVIQEVN